MFESLDKAASGDASLLVSQCALPGDVCAAADAADPRYPQSAANPGQAALASDKVSGDNIAEQIGEQIGEQIAAPALAVTGDAAAGYLATATVGIASG